MLTSPLAATTYQLSAVNHLGETKTTSITVSVEVCSNDKIAFTLEFVMEGGGSECSFELQDLSHDQIVASRTKFANWNTLSLPMCQHATTYGLILKKTDYGGWGSNYVNVKLVDGTLLGILASLIGLRLPAVLESTVHSMASATTPMALVLLGALGLSRLPAGSPLERCLLWLGDMTLELYLVHEKILAVLSKVLFPNHAGSWAINLLAFALAVAAAWCLRKLCTAIAKRIL